MLLDHLKDYHQQGLIEFEICYDSLPQTQYGLGAFQRCAFFAFTPEITSEMLNVMPPQKFQEGFISVIGSWGSYGKRITAEIWVGQRSQFDTVLRFVKRPLPIQPKDLSIICDGLRSLDLMYNETYTYTAYNDRDPVGEEYLASMAYFLDQLLACKQY